MFSLFSRFRKNNQNKIIILLFHRVGIARRHSFGPMSTTFMTSDFEKVISSISEHYQVLALDDALEQLSAGIDKNSIVISFDDGYQDTYTEALPVLEKYQVPATVYITSGFISREIYPYEFLLAEFIAENKEISYEMEESNFTEKIENISDKLVVYNKLKGQLRPLSDSIRQDIFQSLCDENIERFTEPDMFMDWSQVKEMKNHSLITIGAHTYSHAQLDLVNEEDASLDIQKGISDIEKNLDMKINHFAYPYGGYNQTIINLADKNGFKSAVTTKPDYITRGKTKNYLKLPRVELSHKDIAVELQKLQNMFSI